MKEWGNIRVKSASVLSSFPDDMEFIHGELHELFDKRSFKLSWLQKHQYQRQALVIADSYSQLVCYRLASE